MMSSRGRVAVKRAIDTVVILVLSPVLVVAIVSAALAVRVSMGAPVFFAQPRVGMGERIFSVLKLRTMTNARDKGGALLPDSERLTKTGKLLRRLSLDELPQLVNVLRGEMALVGPRPLLVEYLPFYREHERSRHDVRPGITGAAQVAGRNGLLWDSRLRIDAEYAEYATLKDDMRIIAATIRSVFTASGVSVVAGDSGERLDIARSYPSIGSMALRRLELADAERRVAWFADERTAVHMNVPSNVSVARTREWILESRKQLGRKDLVLVDTSTGALLAMLGVRPEPDPRSPEIHVLVDPDRHGEGLGTKAVTLLLQWLRRQAGVTGCWLTVHPENIAAVRLYQRLGFVHVGSALGDRMKMAIAWGAKDD